VLPDGTHTCFIAPPAAAQCRRVSEGEGLGANPGAAFDEQIRANPDAFSAQFTGTRQIAGTSASCYGLNGAAAGFGQATICYTVAGVPLFYQFDVLGLGLTMTKLVFLGHGYRERAPRLTLRLTSGAPEGARWRYVPEWHTPR
jgi:hypothetical protein